MLSQPVFNQVRVLVANLSKKSFKAINYDVKGLVESYGEDVRSFFLRCLLDNIDFIDQKAVNDTLKIQLVSQELSEMMTKSNFVSLLCKAIDISKFSEGFLLRFTKVLKLPLAHQISVSLALSLGEDAKVAEQSRQFLLSKLSEAYGNLKPPPPPAVAEQLLSFLQRQKEISEEKWEDYFLDFYPNLRTKAVEKTNKLRQMTGKSIFSTKEPMGTFTLAMTISSMGPSSMQSKEALKKILSNWGRRHQPEDIAHLIGMMTEITHKGGDRIEFRELIKIMDLNPKAKASGDIITPDSWNIRVFVDTIQELFPRHIWHDIYQKFDYPEFYISEKKGFSLLVDIFKKGAPGSSFPLDPFLREWKNSVGQLSFIRHAIKIDGFFSSSNRVHKGIDGSEAKARSSWMSLDLIESLINLSNKGIELYGEVWEIFRIGLTEDPDMLLCGLLQLPHHSKSPVVQELFSVLVPQTLWGYMTKKNLLKYLWKSFARFVVNWMITLCSSDTSFLETCVNICKDIGILQDILNTENYAFSLKLAARAAEMSVINFETWLRTQIAQFREPFITACLEYLRLHSTNMKKGEFSPVAVTIFNCLFDSTKLMSQQTLNELQHLYEASGSVKKDVSDANTDVEKEAHLYFKQIYEGKVSLEEVIDTLQKYKVSSQQREQEMFACMIHALFDEYRFFAQYPEKELRITGVLFGLLIKHRLVYRTTLGIALRYVLDALQKKPNSNVFQFGMWALEQFKGRLHQWPQYCALIVKIPHLQSNYTDLLNYINKAAGMEGQANGEGKIHSGRDDTVDSKLEAKQKLAMHESKENLMLSQERKGNIIQEQNMPPEAIRDKIHFLINNLSLNNIEAKITELKEFLRVPHYPYFSYFLVGKRVVQESNHLKMYSTFLNKFDDRKVYRVIIHDTYDNIRVKLGSENLVASFDERKVLKNLGMWLGLMTVARNKPVLAKKLKLKELVIQAYGDGRLIAIIPFVTKILEQTLGSKIFKPPNPWLMSLLKLLREIMEVENLKLNLKFAIECLFAQLHIEVADVTPTSKLKGMKVHIGNLKPSETEPSPRIKPKEPPQKEQAPVKQPQAEVQEPEANLQFVKISPSIPLFQQYPDLKRDVVDAVEKAIQDILPVVERSVQIACVTTRQLVMKDFSLEKDHKIIRKASHQMVRKLTSSLALVTSKEPLRVSISQNLLALLEKRLAVLDRAPPDRNLLEHACLQVSADNLELGCKLVEKAASDRAVYDIDEQLTPFYASKKQGMSQNTFPADLPETLKPRTDGTLTRTQMKVYNEFGSADANPDIKRAANAEIKEAGSISPIVDQQNGQGQVLEVTNQTIMKNLMNAYFNLKKAIRGYSEAIEVPLTSLPNNEKTREIQKILSVFPTLLQAAKGDSQQLPREVLYLQFANNIFKNLFANQKPLMISSLCAVLKCVLAAYPAAIDRISEWLLARDEPERKFVKPVTTALIGNHLVDPRYVDEYLKKVLVNNLTQGEPTPARVRLLERTVDLSITLIQELVIKEQIHPPEAFRNIIEVLLHLPKSIAGPFDRSIQLVYEGLTALRPEAQAKATSFQETKYDSKAQSSVSFKVHDLPVPVEDPEQQGLRQRVCYLLDDWLTICLEGTVSDQTYAQYLSLLRQQGLLQSTKSTNLFFRLITELCIEAAYSTNKGQSKQTLSYTTIDALAKLVVFIVKFLDNSSKIALLSAFLQVAAYVLIRDHDAKKHYKSVEGFNQKPFLRLFTNLLYDLNTPDPALDSSNQEVLNAFTHAFHILRPSRVPGFAFAWMELIAHRMFMPKLLLLKERHCLIMFKTLVIDLLSFLKPYLDNADLVDQIKLLYKGTLRILLVLLHDFPEFLCEFHFSFCNEIPITCIQMRNLILSAFPRNVRLPDPLTPNLKVDLLPEISHPPQIGCDVEESLVEHNILRPLEQYLSVRQPSNFPDNLCDKLKKSSETKSGCKYDVKLINSLVLHVGMQGIAKLQVKNEMVSQFQDNSCMDIFERLVTKLDAEGRYYVLNAIANQLRYPNNHTHYFSCVLLYLFLQSDVDIVKEQITRVLLERLIVHQPHPWGLLITFIELIKNPQYSFTRQPFTNCAPEITRLFESVARSCMQTKEETVPIQHSVEKEKIAR
mmetsp:Transcript_2543/g.3674  ORF Transcript_2543/g.3674 Transcript_2543/m.3674 type:complete len:2114 (+) Transcript_2543:96-6437(+)